MKTPIVERAIHWLIRVVGGGVLVNLLSSFLIEPSKFGTAATMLLGVLPAASLILLASATLPSGLLGPSRYGGSNLSRLLSIVLVLGYVLGSANLANTPSWRSIASILCLWAGASLVTWRSFTTRYTIQFTLALTSNLLFCTGLFYIGMSSIVQVKFTEGLPYLIASIALLIFILSPILWDDYPWRWTGAPPLLLCISGTIWGLNLSRHESLIGVGVMILCGIFLFIMIIASIFVIIMIQQNQFTGGERVMYREMIIRAYGLIVGLVMIVGSVSILAYHTSIFLIVCGILGLVLSVLVPLPYLANASVASRVGFVLLVTTPLVLLCGIERCYNDNWLLGISLLCHACVGGYIGMIYAIVSAPSSLKRYVASFLIWLQKKPD